MSSSQTADFPTASRIRSLKIASWIKRSNAPGENEKKPGTLSHHWKRQPG
jgi:hypothetical protein